MITSCAASQKTFEHYNYTIIWNNVGLEIKTWSIWIPGWISPTLKFNIGSSWFRNSETIVCVPACDSDVHGEVDHVVVSTVDLGHSIHIYIFICLFVLDIYDFIYLFMYFYFNMHSILYVWAFWKFNMTISIWKINRRVIRIYSEDLCSWWHSHIWVIHVGIAEGRFGFQVLLHLMLIAQLQNHNWY